MRRLTVSLLLALTLVSGAAAASLDDLRSLGYTVAKASDCSAGRDNAGAEVFKTTWSVSGFGVSTYLSECSGSFQSELDSLANPAVHYERRWQAEHPDQVQAAQTIAAKCYSIGRTAPATDSWRITGTGVDVTVPGADMPGLAGSLADLRAPDGSCTAPATVAIVPSTDSAGTVTVPGQTDTAAAPAPAPAPATEPAAAPADTSSADPSSASSTSVTVEQVQAAEASAAQVTALVDELDKGATEAESLRMANAILDVTG